MTETGGRRGVALNIGEALVDIVNIVAAAAGDPSEFVGGSPCNVAIGLARLGHGSRLLGWIGRDARGERIAELLAAESVTLLPESLGAQRTPTALAEIAPDGSANYTFDIEWAIPAVDPGDVDLVHVGSIGLFLEPGGSEVVRLIRERAGAALVTLDPNIRPSLLGSREDTLARFEAAAEAAHLVKLSDEDAAWLYPGLDAVAAAERVRSFGPRIVVVTLGAGGALAVSAAGVARVAAVPVTVADTISAGDSFMAALVACLLESGCDAVEAALPDALQRAAHAAAIAVSEPGANPPTRAALDAVAGQWPPTRGKA